MDAEEGTIRLRPETDLPPRTEVRNRLTDEMVASARQRAANGERVSDLAREMDVRYSRLLSAVRGDTYSTAPGDPVPPPR